MGVDPLVVYRIVAPDVEQERDTCVEPVNVPPLGEILGAATCGTPPVPACVTVTSAGLPLDPVAVTRIVPVRDKAALLAL